MKGRPKNYFPDESIKKIHETYSEWKDAEGVSKVIKNEEAIKNDYNLSPSRYVAQNGGRGSLTNWRSCCFAERGRGRETIDRYEIKQNIRKAWTLNRIDNII